MTHSISPDGKSITCPFCGAKEKEPRDGARAWFICGTYALAADLTQYRRRSELCFAYVEVNELTAGIVLWRNLCTKFAEALRGFAHFPRCGLTRDKAVDLLHEFDDLVSRYRGADTSISAWPPESMNTTAEEREILRKRRLAPPDEPPTT